MLYLELAIIVLLIVVNGLLAMAEMAIVSSRRAKLQSFVDRKLSGSRRAMALASDPGRFLSTVQIGITLVGVISGAFSGATLGLRVGEALLGWGVATGIAEPAGVAIVVALITYASLIAGELVPKQIALRNPERIALRVAPMMTVIAHLGSPIVWFLNFSGRSVLRLLRQSEPSEERVTDEEIHSLVAEAATAGVIEHHERDMIAGVMRLGDRGARAVMTPRTEVDTIDLSEGDEAVRRAIMASGHSRLPVHEGSADEILGVVQIKAMLNAYINGEQPNVRDHILPAPTIPDTADALTLIDLIRSSPSHLVLVHDEYGHFEGIVTSADILEAIVGALQNEEGVAESDAVQRQDGSWLLSGSMAADEMAHRLKISIPSERDYNTAAGFILERLGYLPKTGEALSDQGWTFEVVDLDGRRIDKILASRAEAA